MQILANTPVDLAGARGTACKKSTVYSLASGLFRQLKNKNDNGGDYFSIWRKETETVTVLVLLSSPCQWSVVLAERTIRNASASGTA